MKIFVVGGATEYIDFIENAELVDSIEDAEVVLFTGGEDVTPSYYGCKKHRSTHNNLNRDKQEKKVFNSVRPDQLCVGVCRGSQWLCVMNGGLLVQNCTGHALWGTHSITNGTYVYEITSTHHQMQYPYNLNSKDYDMLYTSTHNLSTEYTGDKVEFDKIYEYGEPEVVLYHKEGLPKCLAIQGHPEMIPESPVAKMLSNLINELVDELRNLLDNRR